MKVLVIGGCGYIGHALVEVLGAAGLDVTVATRSLTSVSGASDVVLWNADYPWRWPTPSFHLLIHLAGPNGDEASIEDRVQSDQSTLNVIELCSRISGCGLLYFSSFQVFGRWSGVVSDSSKPHPISAYGVAHLHNETLIAEFGVAKDRRTMSVRPTNVYGAPSLGSPVRWNRVPAEFCRQAVTKGEIEIRGDPNAERNFLPLSSLSERILALVFRRDKWNHESRIIGSGKSVTIGSMAESVATEAADILDSPIRVLIKGQSSLECEPLKVAGGRQPDLQLVSDQGIDTTAELRRLLTSAANASF